MSVVRLVDKAAGFPTEDVHQLCQWLRDWADHLESPGSWVPKTVIVVVESDAGGLGVISQSLEVLDKARVLGLLQLAVVRKACNNAEIEDL